ncbi:hypothetical protein CHU98_g2491 [Xylaria longipes]|nr:hypothetical protein CHU98_g2491 [Xylaria longipes]
MQLGFGPQSLRRGRAGKDIFPTKDTAGYRHGLLKLSTFVDAIRRVEEYVALHGVNKQTHIAFAIAIVLPLANLEGKKIALPLPRACQGKGRDHLWCPSLLYPKPHGILGFNRIDFHGAAWTGTIVSFIENPSSEYLPKRLQFPGLTSADSCTFLRVYIKTRLEFNRTLLLKIYPSTTQTYMFSLTLTAWDSGCRASKGGSYLPYPKVSLVYLEHVQYPSLILRAEGRLNQAALNLLEGADIQFRRENRLDIALVKNLPIALIFLPAADIPTFVGEGQVDLGITGWDQVQEHDAGVRALYRARRFSGEITPEEEVAQNGKGSGCETVMDLGFGGCKLQVQVPQNGIYHSPKDLVGKNIGTSFVHLAQKYFANLELEVDTAGAQTDKAPVPFTSKLRTNIIELSGSVEAACALGVADGIVDLVESGETMKAAGLKPIDTVVESSAILIKSRNPSNPELVELIAQRIRGVITAQKYVLCQYNIRRSILVEAHRIAPGKRAPTVTSLDEEGWVAVSVMVEKKRIAPIMDELSRIGAHDILVLDIKNSRD